VRIKKLGDREVRQEVDRLRKRLGLSTVKFADLAATATRDTVLRNAQPFGTGKKAEKAGRKQIAYDLSRVFKVVPDAARGRSGVITSLTAAESWHQSRRGSRGRTTRGQKKKIIQSVYRMYLQTVWKKVGMAKGSVLGGMPSRLGSIRAQWVKRHKSEGSSDRRKSILGAVWTFKAEPEHVASNNVLGERGVKRAMKFKERALRTKLRGIMRSELKKAEKRVNRGA